MIKRISTLFDKSVLSEMEEKPVESSKGVSAAMTFINDVLMCQLPKRSYFSQNMKPIEKLLNTGHSEHDDLERALGKSSRVSSVIKMCFPGWLKVYIYFHQGKEIILQIDMQFNLVTGDSGSMGMNISGKHLR